MTTATTGIGLKRLQHLVLWVSDVARSARFYHDVLGFEVKTRYPRAAFLKIPGSPDDHHLGPEPGEQLGAARPRLVLRQVEDTHAVQSLAHVAPFPGEGPGLIAPAPGLEDTRSRGPGERRASSQARRTVSCSAEVGQ